MSKKDSVYAIKFAIMQHQINEKDKRIKELEDRCKEHQVLLISANNDLENSIPKQKVKDKIKEIQEDKESEYYYMFSNFSDIQKCIGILEELLEEKQ